MSSAIILRRHEIVGLSFALRRKRDHSEVVMKKFFLFAFFSIFPSVFAQAAPYIKSFYSLPLTLDPIKMNDTASLAVSNLIYDGLLKFSPKLELGPALAESWTTSSDGKEITFKLRPNAIFHNGSAISAQDVKFSLERALSPESRVRKLYDCIAKIETPDKLTVVIKLNHPFPPFLSVLAGASAKILPKKLVSTKEFFIHPVGSGAFRYIERLSKEKRILLEAFDGYYSGTPRIQEMILEEHTEAEALALAKAGRVHDLANWPLTSTNNVFNFGKRITSPVAATWIIGLNTTKPPFNNVGARQAFKSAIKPNEFRERFYPDAIPATGYVPFGLSGSGVVTQSVLKNFVIPKEKVTLVIPAELEKSNEMKNFFERSFKGLGWKFEVQVLPWDRLMAGYSNKSHQAFLVSMNMDYPDAEFLLRNFESTNPDNFSGIRNTKLDFLIAQSRTLQDRKKREVVYHEALELLDELSVTVNLFYPRANSWISNCVQGFEPNILSDVYIDYTKVSLDTPCSGVVVKK